MNVGTGDYCSDWKRACQLGDKISCKELKKLKKVCK
jgi:hypothetical protein